MAMSLKDIRQMPVCWPPQERRQPNEGGWHESVMRGYQILQKVKELLARNTPADVILEIVEDLERGDPPGGPANE